MLDTAQTLHNSARPLRAAHPSWKRPTVEQSAAGDHVSALTRFPVLMSPNHQPRGTVSAWTRVIKAGHKNLKALFLLNRHNSWGSTESLVCVMHGHMWQGHVRLKRETSDVGGGSCWQFAGSGWVATALPWQWEVLVSLARLGCQAEVDGNAPPHEVHV